MCKAIKQTNTNILVMWMTLFRKQSKSKIFMGQANSRNHYQNMFQNYRHGKHLQLFARLWLCKIDKSHIVSPPSGHPIAKEGGPKWPGVVAATLTFFFLKEN